MPYQSIGQLNTGVKPVISTTNLFPTVVKAPVVNANSLNDIPSLNKALKAGSINSSQWMQRFKTIQAPSNKVSTVSNASLLGTALNKTFVKTPVAIGKGAVQSENTVAKGLARIKPGGLADINAQEQQAQSANNAVVQAITLQKEGKISKAAANKLIQLNASNASAASSAQAATIKSLPTKGQLAAGAAGTATDILTAGTLPELKSGVSGAKAINAATKATGYGAAGGLNAASAGGTKKQIAENAIAGAALPGVLHGAGKGFEAAKVISGRDTAVNDLINKTKSQNLADTLTRIQSGGSGPRSALDNIKQTRPLNDLQTQIENAHNSGDTALESKLTKQLPDQAMNPNASLSAEEKAALMQKARQKSGLSSNESGSVAPGQVIKDTQALLDRHAKLNDASLDLQKNADITANKNLLNETEVAQNLDKRTPISPADKQILQDYRDAKAAGLKPEPLPKRLEQADTQTTAYAKAQIQRDAAAARASGNMVKAAKIEMRDPESYTHREAIGKGSNLELTMRGDKQSPSSLGQFGRKTGSSNARTMMAATDEAGNRRVIGIDKNKVTAFNNGKKSDLGNLNLKKNQDFLDKELSPYQAKVKNLQTEYDALSKVKTKGGVSDARINALAHKAALLEDPGNMSTLSKSEARSLRDAQIKLKELTNVKEPGTNAEGRLKTINQKLIDLNNKIGEIHNKYDPEELNQKAFVGKDGTKYTLGQATTSEITKHSGQKYYVDPELTNALAYNDSQKALNNTHFIESTKKLLEDKQLAYPKDETAPKNFKPTTNPYFPGYKLDPKIAEVLDDIAGRTNHSLTGEAADEVSHFLRQTIVYLPIKHDFNMIAGYAIDRGLSKWLNPVSDARAISSIASAVKSVATHDQKWQDVAKTDFSLVSGDGNVLGKVVKNQLKDTLSNKQRVALFAKTTKLNPVRAYKALQQVSVFDVQDVLNLARINDRMKGTTFTKGQSLEDAVNATKKYNFQYKMPSRAALPGKAGRIVKETLGSDKVYFGNYTYDKYRIAKNIVKDTVNVKHPKQALEAADKLAATVFIASAVWPLVNKGLQTISGDKNAHITAPGVSSVAELAQKVATHKEAPLAAAGSQVSIASPVNLGAQLLGNTDSFTKKQIHDPNASAAQKTEATAKWLFSQLSPTQKVATSGNASTNRGLSTALSLAGASFPKSSPEATKLDSLKYDSLPNVQAQARAAAASGDTKKAVGIIAKYDQQILAQAAAAAKAEGRPMPSATQLKSAGYYYDPENATVQSWSKAKPASGGTLNTILNTKVAPKKGQPGYTQYRAKQNAKTRAAKVYDKSHPNAKKGVI